MEVAQERQKMMCSQQEVRVDDLLQSLSISSMFRRLIDELIMTG